ILGIALASALCSIGVVYVVCSMALCSIGVVYVVRSMALYSIGGVYVYFEVCEFGWKVVFTTQSNPTEGLK
ncbi:hypothetical protein Tco_0387818, partial [Tanacetum coccineum]